MTARLAFRVCPHFVTEFTRVLERVGVDQPEAHVEPLGCDCAAKGGCLQPPATALVPGEAPRELPSCLELIGGRTLTRTLEEGGARLASPSMLVPLLANARKGAPSPAGAARELVLLDTGTAETAPDRARELAAAWKVEVRTIPVGLDHLEAALGRIVDQRRLSREQQWSRVQLAASELRREETFMALEHLAKLVGAETERDAAERICELVTTLFCPREVAYMGFSEGVRTLTLPERLPEAVAAQLEGFEGEPAAVDDGSFIFGLRARGGLVGAVRVGTLVSPQHRDDAMKLSRLLSGHCAEAVANARSVVRNRQLELELREHYKLESVGRLAAGVAHELNTPTQFVGDNVAFVLSGLAGLSEMFARGAALTDKVAEGTATPADAEELRKRATELDLDYFIEAAPQALQQSSEGMARIASIVQSLQSFARPGDANPEYADLNQLLRTTLEVARNEYKYVANVKLDLAELPRVYGYAAELNQVFLALLVNAAKAIEPVAKRTGVLGTITIKTWAEFGHVFVSIEDTSEGVDIEPPEHLFEQFFTHRSSSPQSRGLPMVWQLVEKHGGSVTFETRQGTGTVFILEFPAAADAKEAS